MAKLHSQKEMKILLICPYFFEPHRWMISAYKTALYLSKKHQVVVLTAGRPYKEQLNDNLTIYRMKDVFIPDPVNLSIIPALAWYVYQVILKERPTHFIVNKHMFFTSFSVPLLKLIGKKVVTVTDTFPGVNWFPRNKYLKVVHKVLAACFGMPFLKMSNKAVLLHEGLVDVAKQYKLNYQVIHNGVDLEAIDAAKPLPEYSDTKYINIVYVGRLETIKGYTDIVAAAHTLTAKHKNVRFILVGNSAGKEEWIKEHESDQIIFTGHRNDAIRFMKSAQIFVLASYSEGLPNALMEAMACNLACVSSEVGGVKVLIKPEENGLVFPAGEIPAMESQLERLIQDGKLRDQLGKAARQTITEHFAWSKIAEEYEKLLKSLD